ncbi:MAG: trimeric autotransporter adhesin [Solirubrobacteraceae bacterium]|nr:trimeric autotransporter adhesin [Solirubrobacteraceae bacterium]
MISRLTMTAKSARAWMALALLGVLALSGWAAWTALAASAPPTPTISSSPANPTNATSVTFNYSSSSATGFLCKLDASASFTTCPTAGITYAGLASGSHTFRVQAVDQNGHASSAASYSWVIDRTAPTFSSIVRADATPTKSNPLRWTVTSSEPVKNVTTSNFTPLVTSNLGGTSPTVTAVAPSGSAPSSIWTVTASTSGTTGSNSGSIGLNLTGNATIQDAAGNALGASVPMTGQQYTFDTTPPTTSGVSIVRNAGSPTNAASVSWTVTFGEAVSGVVAANFSLAASGLSGAPTITGLTGSGTTRTITASTGTGTPSGSGALQLKLVRASAISDLAGNALIGALPVSGQTYTIDRLAPPVAFTTKPADPSSVSTSQFSWTSQPASDVDHFECATENGAFSTQVPSQGGPAKPCVSPLSYVVATSNNGRHQFGLRAYDHAGNFIQITYSWKVAAGSTQNFAISGNAVGLLYPGAPAQVIALKLTNPHSVAILVTDAQVTVASSSSAGCGPATNVAVTQSDVSATNSVQIPAGASVTLPTQRVAAPTIRMLNLTTNQDACKNATFSLSYDGSAHS